jgi:phenylalanyl-tRNA synthetase alpha chain
MHPELTEQILKYVADHEKVDTLDLVNIFNVEHQKIIGAKNSIEATGDLLTSEPTSRKVWELTAEGKSVTESGSHEALVYNAVPAEGIAQADLMKVGENSRECFIIFQADLDYLFSYSFVDITQCQSRI